MRHTVPASLPGVTVCVLPLLAPGFSTVNASSFQSHRRHTPRLCAVPEPRARRAGRETLVSNLKLSAPGSSRETPSGKRREDGKRQRETESLRPPPRAGGGAGSPESAGWGAGVSPANLHSEHDPDDIFHGPRLPLSTRPTTPHTACGRSVGAARVGGRPSGCARERPRRPRGPRPAWHRAQPRGRGRAAAPWRHWLRPSPCTPAVSRLLGCRRVQTLSHARGELPETAVAGVETVAVY